MKLFRELYGETEQDLARRKCSVSDGYHNCYGEQGEKGLGAEVFQ